MTLDFIKDAYFNEQSNSDELEDAIEQVFNNPTEESDDFFFSIIENYDSGNHPFWINQAIIYSDKAIDKVASQKKLENILVNISRYWLLGAALATVAIQLGRFTKYPNTVLGQTIEISPKVDDELDRIILLGIQRAAYGAYIMTATDFFTGWDAKNEVESSGVIPTKQMAEEFIKN